MPEIENDGDGQRRNTRKALEGFLSEMIEHPERRDDLMPQVEEVFGQERAVMVLDMSGFSRTTKTLGVVPFLLMIHQMKLVVRPALKTYGGVLVKAEADNLFCLFETVDRAVAASRATTQRLNVVNLLLPEAKRLYVSIGIGFGRILNIEDEDLFGDQVNLASKLGEDVAGMGEILLTSEAAAMVTDSSVKVTENTVSVSGLTLGFFKVEE
jgi:adenylate cyclase